MSMTILIMLLCDRAAVMDISSQNFIGINRKCHKLGSVIVLPAMITLSSLRFWTSE